MANRKSAKKPTEAQTETPTVSQQDVFDVLRFAAMIYEPTMSNPLLINQRMKDVTLSPIMATAEKIDEALTKPKDSENLLTGYSEFFDLTSMIYRRILLYLSGMLSFDYTYLCRNVQKDSEYTSKAYERDSFIVQEFLDNFNIKKEFKTVLRQIVRNEVYFGLLREEGERYTLQELPKDYCLITGRWDYGLLFDFDMNWFFQAGVDIRMYPPIFSEMYQKVFGSKPTDDYRASAPVNSRTGAWVKWVQSSPKDGFWAFKMSPELATRIPFLAPLFPDMVLQPIIRKLQTNSYIATATKMLIGKVPLLDKSVKGASVKDNVAVTPDMLGKFLSVLKAGLGDVIKAGAAPLEDMQGLSFPGDSPFYQEYLKTSSSSSGVNSRLIYTLDKNNAVESQLSINVDEFLMTYVYPQFSDFLEYYINRRTKKYKFKITFEGTEFYTNRKERLETALVLADRGIVLPQKIAAAIGMSPLDFKRQLAEGKASEFVANLTPIQTSFTMTGNQQGEGKGRPKSADNNLSESAENARTNGTNVEAGGDE